MISARYQLDAIDAEVEEAVDELVAADAVALLFAKDHELYGADTPEVANRMGWIDIAARTEGQWSDLVADAEVIAERADHVVLMGMGGSSLFPEVLASTFGAQPGRPRLHVIDSTSPTAIARVAAACPTERTFHVAASKSGSTLETRSHLAWFRERSGDPTRFGVITDPGSALGADARAAGFAHVWENDPDIGGRYSALSLFGMVPAALAGVDGSAILEAALDQTDALEPLGDEGEHHIGLRLGAAIGAAARHGRTSLTIVLDPRVETFGLWLEQLVAESLGKHGVGAIPIVGEELDHVIATPEGRLVIGVGDVDLAAVTAPRISLSLEEPTDIGAHVVLWEVAVALAGKVLGINPFDQPDVEAAKAAARRLLDSGVPADSAVTPLDDALAAVGPGDVVVICAFVDPAGEAASRIVEVRHHLGRHLGVPTTLGFGPRFLHSTGQLHKGGPANIVVIQAVDHVDPADDLAIPDLDFSFGTLLVAQAAGDLEALHQAGKRAFRVPLDELSRWSPA